MMGAAEIRLATLQDAPQIAEIWNVTIRDTVNTFNPDPFSDVEIMQAICNARKEDHAFLVASQDEDVLGFARYSQFRGGRGYARSFEHSVNLAVDQRGAGLGTKLMDALEAHAQARQGRWMIAAITGQNAASVRFHERRGYREFGRLPDAGWKFDRFHELILMGKDLTLA